MMIRKEEDNWLMSIVGNLIEVLQRWCSQRRSVPKGGSQSVVTKEKLVMLR